LQRSGRGPNSARWKENESAAVQWGRQRRDEGRDKMEMKSYETSSVLF